MDDCGNTTTHVQTITVTDTENPAITGTPADISQDNDAGSCDAVVTWTEPTASDNCTLDTLYSTHAPGDTFAVGTTTVTYTAEDDCGNTTTTSFSVTIVDAEAPTLSNVPSNITQTNDAGCLLYTSPSPRDLSTSRMPSSA